MLRHAIAPSRDYLKAPHAIVRHARLNSDAKMLLLYVLGLPESKCGKPLGEHAARLGIKPRAYQKAKALLVECGFLRENKWQNDRGRWVTEQMVTNDVLASPGARFPTAGDSTDRVVGASPAEREEQGKNTPHPPPEGEPEPEPESRPEPQERPEPQAQSQPLTGELAEAERVLLSLRHLDRRLHLGVPEARRLAATAVEWLRRGVSPGELRLALGAGLPAGGVRSAVGFLRYRLVEKLPEVPSLARTIATATPPPGRDRGELVLCAGPGDDHAFRPVAGETECGECRREAAAGAAGFGARPQEDAVRLTWRERVAAATCTA
ncbi:hypothetical protein [Streptomyces sp. Wb2n-11]|uniref:hypothetical protein n=1 Tax=Streptomyces sp. Wb2n-11 TaxID=1030533 RepID=UPI000A830A74|nr:hypothetical protein [Streptomyces sp. Wb2n-11]